MAAAGVSGLLATGCGSSGTRQPPLVIGGTFNVLNTENSHVREHAIVMTAVRSTPRCHWSQLPAGVTGWVCPKALPGHPWEQAGCSPSLLTTRWPRPHRRPLTSKVFPVTSNSGGTKAPSGSSGERQRRCCDHTPTRRRRLWARSGPWPGALQGPILPPAPSPALVPEGRETISFPASVGAWLRRGSRGAVFRESWSTRPLHSGPPWGAGGPGPTHRRARGTPGAG